AVADLDMDGDHDLAVAIAGADSVAVLGNGDGTFVPALTLPTGTTPTEVHSADVDSDARPDLVTTNRFADGISVMRNTTVPDFADVAVTMTATPRFGLLVPALEYTISVRNSGPDTLDTATITAALPAYTTVTPGPGCTVANRTLTCAIAPMANGATTTKTFRIPVGLLTITTYKITAKRAASLPADPKATNDSATVTCSVIGIVAASCN
ncbi:MAG TPA: FG-GAP-like repeat-containing protein, partial [Actinokineospora sp.]|nr:FG-GAP-like repeat-containing protein [Actinokineospora sp.]